MPTLRQLDSSRGVLTLVNPDDIRDSLKFTARQESRNLFGHPQTANKAEWVFNWAVDLVPCDSSNTCKTGVEIDSIRVYVSGSLENKAQLKSRLEYALATVLATDDDMLSGFTPAANVPAYVKPTE